MRRATVIGSVGCAICDWSYSTVVVIFHSCDWSYSTSSALASGKDTVVIGHIPHHIPHISCDWSQL